MSVLRSDELGLCRMDHLDESGFQGKLRDSLRENVSHPPHTLVFKHIELDDDPNENIFPYLKEACDWINKGLRRNLEQDSQQPGVLVHCRQGISRSGAVVVAYCELALPMHPLFTYGILTM